MVGWFRRNCRLSIYRCVVVGRCPEADCGDAVGRGCGKQEFCAGLAWVLPGAFTEGSRCQLRSASG